MKYTKFKAATVTAWSSPVRALGQRRRLLVCIFILERIPGGYFIQLPPPLPSDRLRMFLCEAAAEPLRVMLVDCGKETAGGRLDPLEPLVWAVGSRAEARAAAPSYDRCKVEVRLQEGCPFSPWHVVLAKNRDFPFQSARTLFKGLSFSFLHSERICS